MNQNESSPRKTFSNLIRILINVLPALILGLVLFYVVMRPPMNEFAIMLRLMSITAVFSVLLTFSSLQVRLDISNSIHENNDHPRQSYFSPCGFYQHLDHCKINVCQPT